MSERDEDQPASEPKVEAKPRVVDEAPVDPAADDAAVPTASPEETADTSELVEPEVVEPEVDAAPVVEPEVVAAPVVEPEVADDAEETVDSDAPDSEGDAEPRPDGPQLVEAIVDSAPTLSAAELRGLLGERVALQEAVTDAEARLEENQARLRAVSKAYRDLQEEMTVFRRRMEQRSEARVHNRLSSVARAIFEPVQNLRRSLDHRGDDLESFAEGIEMVLGQFIGALEQQGFQEVPGVGALFDPSVHEALAVVPVMDASQDGRVLAVQTTGYVLGGKVLQAAQVIVGKHEVVEE